MKTAAVTVKAMKKVSTTHGQYFIELYSNRLYIYNNFFKIFIYRDQALFVIFITKFIFINILKSALTFQKNVLFPSIKALVPFSKLVSKFVTSQPG